MSQSLLRLLRRFLSCLALLCAVAAAPTAPAAPATRSADAGPGAGPSDVEPLAVEPPAETERALAELRKADAEAREEVKAWTAARELLHHAPPDAQADNERRLEEAKRKAAEAAALLRLAAAVEPYMPAAERARVRALPRAQRLQALSARPADEMLRVVVPEVKVDGVALNDVMDFLCDLTGLNLLVDWRALEAAGIDRGAAVTVHIQNTSARDVLAQVLQNVKAGREIQIATDDNVVLLTNKSTLQTHRATAKRLAAALAAADANAKAVMERRIPEVNFNGVGLGDAVDFLRDVSGANLFADWKRLNAAGVSSDAPLTCRLNNVRFREALELMADQLADDKGQPRAALTIDGRVVILSTPAGLDAVAAARKELDALSAKDEKARAVFGRKLKEINFNAVGLKDACDFMKDVTGTAVEADWDALSAAGCPPDTQVSLRLNDVTAGEVLLRLADAAAGEKGSPRIGFALGHILLLKPEKPDK